jgi:hypothetical protein
MLLFCGSGHLFWWIILRTRNFLLIVPWYLLLIEELLFIKGGWVSGLKINLLPLFLL